MGKLLPLTLLLTVGCSSTVLSPKEPQLEKEVAELKARVLELQRKAAVTEIEMSRLRQQVAALRLAGELESRSTGSRSTGSRSTGSRTTGLGEASSPVVSPAPPPPIEQTVLDPDDEPTGSAESRASATITDSEQALYDQGYTLYHQGSYLDAEGAFQRFLQMHPESELADNAQYWIGESRYARRDLRGALAAFRETVNRHPTGNKVPDALLKAGQTLEALGDLRSARQTYRELRRRFPDSAAALVAGGRLSDLAS